MKTIRNIKTQEIVRIENPEAKILVNNKTHVYVSKETWKKEVRDTNQ